MTRVLIIEDNPKDSQEILEAIKSNAHTVEPILIRDPIEALTLIKKNEIQVDVVLTALEFAQIDGSEVILKVKSLIPAIPILVLSHIDMLYSVKSTLAKGAKGYILKSRIKSEIAHAISHVDKGSYYISPELAFKSLKGSPGSTEGQEIDPLYLQLTKIHREVLLNIANGLTNKEIGDKLFISKRTVEGIRATLMSKTKTVNTASLISFAFRNGMIT